MNDLNSLPLKNYISKEWTFFKEQIDSFINKNLENINFIHDNFNFVIRSSLSETTIFIFIEEKDKILSLEISKFSRIMEFEKGNNKNSETIFDADDIKRYIEKYQLDHPLYYDIISKKEKSVTSDILEKIIQNKDVNKIYDDGFVNQISQNEFCSCMKLIKLEDFYINKPDNDYTNDINNGKDIYSSKRKELIEFVRDFRRKEGKDILFLGGGNKTGKTITILAALKVVPILYFNIKQIKSKTKKNDIKKLIYRECMHLFINCEYNDFVDFYNNYIEKIKGYNKNIWKLINEYCTIITEYNKISNPIVVLDDYDDIYMKKEEILNRDIINQLLVHKNIKFIVCGNGNFIDDLIYKKETGFTSEQNYEVLYNNDLDLKINNKPFMEYFLEEKEENYQKVLHEFKEYFIKKYKTEEKILSKFIIFEEYVKLKQNFGAEDPDLEGFPIQFFKIIREGDNPYFIIDYLYPKLFEISNDLINYYILKKIKVQINIHSILKKHRIIQGYLIERYIISMFENNIMFEDFNIPNENIITVEEIYNINSNNIQTNKQISNSCPILIKQRKEGIHYDFAIILEKNKEIYALIIQVGLNKKKCEISNVFIATYLKYKILINALSALIGKTISKISLMFIFSKEKQEELNQKLELLKNELNDKEKRNVGDINDIKKNISNIYIGKNFTKEFYIPYLEFSHTSNFLYFNGKEIKYKETFLQSFWPITNAEYKIEEIGTYNFSALFPDFSKDFQDYLKEDDIKEFKIINLIKDIKDIIQDFGMMMFILIDLKEKNQDIIIIHKISNNNNNILKYHEHKFENLKFDKFKKIIEDSNPELVYLCQKVYLDPEENSLLDYMSKGRHKKKRKLKNTIPKDGNKNKRKCKNTQSKDGDKNKKKRSNTKPKDGDKNKRKGKNSIPKKGNINRRKSK